MYLLVQFFFQALCWGTPCPKTEDNQGQYLAPTILETLNEYHKFQETNKLERLLALVGRAAVEQPIVAEVNDLLKNLEDQLRLPCDAYKARALATELQ